MLMHPTELLRSRALAELESLRAPLEASARDLSRIATSELLTLSQQAERILNDVRANGVAAFEEYRNALERELQERFKLTLAEVRPKLEAIEHDLREAIEQLDALVRQKLKNTLRLLELRLRRHRATVQAGIQRALKLIDGLRALTDAIPRELLIRFEWEPRLQDAPRSAPLFEAQLAGEPARLLISAEVRKAVLGRSPPRTSIKAHLRHFQLHLLPTTRFISVGFSELQFSSLDGAPPDVRVKIRGVELGEALGFVAQLAQLLARDTGPYLKLAAEGVLSGFRFDVPAFTLGAFGLSGLRIDARALLPLDGNEVQALLDVGRRFRPFQLSVGLLGGGGFVGLTVGTKHGIRRVEVTLEFGAVVALNLGVASGSAYVMAGVYFSWRPPIVALYGYVRIGGELDVLGLITIRAQFYLALGYERRGDRSYAVGEASITVEIEILFFSFSVGVTVRREIEGGAKRETIAVTDGGLQPPSFPTADDWQAYRSAFAHF
jgi:hypothetical protein